MAVAAHDGTLASKKKDQWAKAMTAFFFQEMFLVKERPLKEEVYKSGFQDFSSGSGWNVYLLVIKLAPQRGSKLGEKRIKKTWH